MRCHTLLLTALLCAGTASIASSQTRAAGPAQPTMTAQPITQALRSAWNGARLNIKESADQMPEPLYVFKPTLDVRSFGQILAHLAGANYVFCSAAKGEKTPHAEDEFEKAATTRPAIITALADSLTYCDGVFAAMDDKKLSEMIDMPFEMPRAARTAALVAEISHMNEHYGNLVTYFRLRGMVPPSSKR
jgi:uncharacterized damage-inducible protein DinB